jgi:hypothetical protein
VKDPPLGGSFSIEAGRPRAPTAKRSQQRAPRRACGDLRATGHGPALFVLARDSHDLVVCERCGERTFVEGDVLEPVRAHVRTVLGFEPRFAHFPLFGLCARCAA